MYICIYQHTFTLPSQCGTQVPLARCTRTKSAAQQGAAVRAQFSKVSMPFNVPYTSTIEQTFENIRVEFARDTTGEILKSQLATHCTILIAEAL